MGGATNSKQKEVEKDINRVTAGIDDLDWVSIYFFAATKLGHRRMDVLCNTRYKNGLLTESAKECRKALLVRCGYEYSIGSDEYMDFISDLANTIAKNKKRMGWSIQKRDITSFDSNLQIIHDIIMQLNYSEPCFIIEALFGTIPDKDQNLYEYLLWKLYTKQQLLNHFGRLLELKRPELGEKMLKALGQRTQSSLSEYFSNYLETETDLLLNLTRELSSPSENEKTSHRYARLRRIFMEETAKSSAIMNAMKDKDIAIVMRQSIEAPKS